MINPTSAPQRTIMTVTQLNRASSQLLSNHFLTVRVEGELSNLSMPSSGHVYFSLKDTNAQVRCAMFKNQQRRQAFKPENGKQVVVKATVSLYEPRGDYQLIVEAIEEAGDGALRRAFEALKRKLSDEGLFDAANKQALPALPQAIGIITSPTGAAVRDILTVLKRRFAAVPVIIYPVAVQGDNAKQEIANAIARANANPLCDIIILGRGGGSLEDLWAFNEEIVARAIFASEIPIISAIGHETDFTIADFVADLRAPTPSAAAEHAAPDSQEWLARFIYLETRLQHHLQRKLREQQRALEWLSKRLQQQHPGQKLARNAQRIDELELRLNQAMRLKLRHQKNRLETQQAKLGQHNPAEKISHYQQKLDYLHRRLPVAIAHKLERMDQCLGRASQTLHAVSPLATLNRGYTLTIAPSTGSIIRSAGQLAIGDMIETRFGRGRCTSEIKTLDRNGGNL
ncbi:MAG: exodeoxyribonuclease VII large subunit [Methylovulum sp.]|nr:exodeoxyribonuclease VII large subunit [Methylovulum sp.]